MKLVKLKLIETLSKSIFYLSIIYFFSIEKSGIFGFFNVVIGLSCIFIGFERYISLQREIVKKSDRISQSKISNLIKFYFFNFFLIIPLYILIVYLKIFDNSILIFCSLIILISEHISTQIYNVCVVYEKYINLMFIIIFKNIILLTTAIILIYLNRVNSLDFIIISWSILGFLILLISAIFFYRKQTNSFVNFLPIKLNDILMQFKLSKIHFLIGLVALIWIQLDRLVVGLWFSPEKMGIYYRHVSIIGIIYQLFNIISYNRLIPKIFGLAKNNNYLFLNKILLKEYQKVFMFIIAISIIMYFIYFIPFVTNIFNNFFLEINLILMLFVWFLIRILSDYRAMIYNAYKLEKLTFKNQTISLFIGLFLMIILIPEFDLYGLVLSSIISVTIYALLMYSIKLKKYI